MSVQDLRGGELSLSHSTVPSNITENLTSSSHNTWVLFASVSLHKLRCTDCDLRYRRYHSNLLCTSYYQFNCVPRYGHANSDRYRWRQHNRLYSSEWTFAVSERGFRHLRKQVQLRRKRVQRWHSSQRPKRASCHESRCRWYAESRWRCENERFYRLGYK